MIVEGYPRRSTDLSYAIVGGRTIRTNQVDRVEIRTGPGGYHRAHGNAQQWVQLVSLKPGKNVVRVRVIDRSGTRSAPKQIVIRRS